MKAIDLSRDSFLFKVLKFANCSAYYDLRFREETDTCSVISGLIKALLVAVAFILLIVLSTFAVASVGAFIFYGDGFEATFRSMFVGFGVGVFAVIAVGFIIAGMFLLIEWVSTKIAQYRYNIGQSKPTTFSQLIDSHKNKYCAKVKLK